MAIEFNKFNNGYNNYNIAIGQQAANEAAKKAEEAKEVVKSDVVFKGLENETDLLTKIHKVFMVLILQNSQQKIKN